MNQISNDSRKQNNENTTIEKLTPASKDKEQGKLDGGKSDYVGQEVSVSDSRRCWDKFFRNSSKLPIPLRLDVFESYLLEEMKKSTNSIAIRWIRMERLRWEEEHLSPFSILIFQGIAIEDREGDSQFREAECKHSSKPKRRRKVNYRLPPLLFVQDSLAFRHYLREIRIRLQWPWLEWNGN